MEAAMIIGEEEGASHHFVNGEEEDTTQQTILSPPVIHQYGDIIIEKDQCGVRGHTKSVDLSKGVGGGGEAHSYQCIYEKQLITIKPKLISDTFHN